MQTRLSYAYARIIACLCSYSYSTMDPSGPVRWVFLLIMDLRAGVHCEGRALGSGYCHTDGPDGGTASLDVPRHRCCRHVCDGSMGKCTPLYSTYCILPLSDELEVEGEGPSVLAAVPCSPSGALVLCPVISLRRNPVWCGWLPHTSHTSRGSEELQ